jgi:hypothetical protein
MAAGISVASWNSAVLRAWFADAEPIQSEFEPLGADGAAGLAAGEQPARRSGGADGGVALALGDDGAGELVDGFG